MDKAQLRSQVITLYKTLLHLGKDYPLGYTYFRDKTHNVFKKNSGVTDPEKITQLIAFGEYICAEVRAMYTLKKYRSMKQRYYSDPEEPKSQQPPPPTN